MNIYLIGMYSNPTIDKLMAMKSVDYAYFSALGTWVSTRSPCQTCDWDWGELAPPLLVQWEKSSNAIGDFSWEGPIGYLFVVKESIVQSLRAMSFDLEYLPVEYVPPARKLKKNLVPYPYDGPTLLWARCNSFVDLDRKASKVPVGKKCRTCGYADDRFRYKGIVIRRQDWHGEDMFRITTNGNSCATFVTEAGRQRILEAELSNVSFTRAGKIID